MVLAPSTIPKDFACSLAADETFYLIKEELTATKRDAGWWRSMLLGNRQVNSKCNQRVSQQQAIPALNYKHVHIQSHTSKEQRRKVCRAEKILYMAALSWPARGMSVYSFWKMNMLFRMFSELHCDGHLWHVFSMKFFCRVSVPNRMVWQDSSEKNGGKWSSGPQAPTTVTSISCSQPQ